MQTGCVRVFAVALLLLTSCRTTDQRTGGGASPRRLNVLLVTIDTLRADRLGCYGYRSIETPNLDRLAQRGTLFENAVAQAPLTAPSHASIMTGLYPTRHKVRDTGGFVLPSSSTTLAAILQRDGWDTAAFVAAAVLKKRFGVNQGFAVYDDEMPAAPAGSGDAAERRAADVVDRATKWLDTQSGKPFLLWVHVYDPHLPYDPPSPFREKYADRPYDGEVAYTDQQLGRLLDTVSKKSGENTIVAILSDHGESLSEHGEYSHGVFLYDTTLRVPLLMAGPGVPAGVRPKQQARTIDLLPTLLDLIGIKTPDGLDGTSLAPTFQGREVAAYSYAETMFPKLNMGWAELRGIRTSRWKYIRAPKPELYDLVQDPAETQNVIAGHPDEVKDLEARLSAVAGNGEKVEPAAVDPRTLQQLKSLGYLGGSTQQKYALEGKGIDPKDRKEIVKLLYFGLYSGLPVARRIGMLRQAVAQDPTNPALYSNLGDLYAQAARPAEAMALYQSAIQKGIRSAWLFSRLGQLTMRQGKREDAIALFEAAAQLNPADYESLQNLAAAYRETGRVADAEGILNSIVKSGEPFAPAYNELGMVWFQKGDLNTARGYFEKAAQLDVTYQLNLGRLYKQQGDKLRARTCFEAFLSAKGASPEYAQMIPQVKRELASVQ
jgi:arylsulfatase A-like enzyme/Flp pilus assembly protein TadD